MVAPIIRILIQELEDQEPCLLYQLRSFYSSQNQSPDVIQEEIMVSICFRAIRCKISQADPY